MEIPLGSRFQPFDYDVVKFLFEFATGRKDDEGVIDEEDIFGDKEPWELIRCGPSENMAYFLSRLKKKGKSTTACRVERTVGKKGKNGKRSGNWHGQDKGKPVLDKKGKFVMGYKRCFIYKNRSEPEQDRQWLLKEFSLPETIIKKARVEYPIVEERKDFVLCRLERKKEDEDDDDDDDEKTTTDLEVETTSSPIMAPSPIQTLALQADGDDDMDSYLASLDGGHHHNLNLDNAILVGGDQTTLLPDDDINSYFNLDNATLVGGETTLLPVDDMNSYLVGVPMETLIVPAKTTLAPAAGDMDRDQDHHISSSVPVETLPELSSSSFMDFICNMEDVTRLIDFDA